MIDGLAAAQFGMAPALASALLHSLWQNAVLAVAAALALRAMKRSSAAARHNVAMVFLIVMAILPVLGFAGFWIQTGPEINDGPIAALTAPTLAPAANAYIQQSSPLAPFIVLAWMVGAAMMLFRHVAALRTLAAMDRGSYQPLPPQWHKRVDRMTVAMGVARTIAVRLSDDVVSPFAARLVRPVIWLPLSLVTRAPADHIEALLAHELAHIARMDWLWNGIQCVIEALLFFNPAVWWLSRRVRQEREHACDDLAVAACGDPIALAEALTALECDRHPTTRFALAAQGGSLMQRISRLLSVPPSRGRWGATAALGALTMCGLLLVAQIGVAGGHVPQLRVSSSTPGVLGPGDYREITANGVDKVRYYRATVDSEGKLTQVYKENGEPRPIDAGVTLWIDEVSRISVPAAPEEIARLHELPAVARIENRPEMKTLFALIARNPEVAAKLGPSAVPTDRQIDGNVTLDDSGGSADIAVEMQGPKGRAIVDVDGVLRNRMWAFQSIDVR